MKPFRRNLVASLRSAAQVDALLVVSFLGATLGGCAQYDMIERPQRAEMQTNGCRMDEVLLCTSRGRHCRSEGHRCASWWTVRAEIDRLHL